MIWTLLLACFVAAGATKKTYEGDQIVAVNVDTADQWVLVRQILQENCDVKNIDVLKEPTVTKTTGVVHLAAEDVSAVLAALQNEALDYTVTIDNLGRLIAEEELANERARRAAGRNIVGTYARYDDIVAWIESIAADYPELASVSSIGQTYEDRDQYILSLGVPSEGGPKWQIWVDGGVHAREWVSPSSVVYIIDQLIQGYEDGDEDIVTWLTKFDFVILPVANPDGYEYCHTTERLWRKNRRPNDDVDSTCVGTDLNRNFAFQWGGVNADTDPCSNLYMGPEPESELETINMVNHIMANNEQYIMYLSYHAWGQQFFTRWDYTGNAAELPDDHEELLSLAERSVAAMSDEHGLFWEAGTAPDLMYAFAGGSADWSRGVAGIKYPYLLELRDDGEFAFELPPEQIIPQGEEVWAGLKVIMEEIVENWGEVAPPSN